LLEWWTGAIHRRSYSAVAVRCLRVRRVSYVLFAFMLGAALARSSAEPDGHSRWEFPLCARQTRSAELRSASSRLTLDSCWLSRERVGSAVGYVPLVVPAPLLANVAERLPTGPKLRAKISAISQTDVNRCIAQNKLHYVVQYQPTSHFWALQGVESAIFIGRPWCSSASRGSRKEMANLARSLPGSDRNDRRHWCRFLPRAVSLALIGESLGSEHPAEVATTLRQGLRKMY